MSVLMLADDRTQINPTNYSRRRPAAWSLGKREKKALFRTASTSKHTHLK